MTRAAQSWRRFVLVAFAAASCARATGGATSPAEKAIGAAQRPVQQAPAPATSTGVTAITWHTSATAYRGKLGQQLAFTCPAAGTAAALWGTGVYTDDSSICTAAVHAGAIKLAAGGTVTIEILAGQANYNASAANGVSSNVYGTYAGSFVVVAGAPPAGSGVQAGTSSNAAVAITWTDNAAANRGKAGWTGLFTCPAAGTASSVWGSGVYTDDSSICTAAVHAGVITLAGGGQVRVAVQAGEPSYQGSTNNGITSTTYGAWAGSIVIVGGQAAAPPPIKTKTAKTAKTKIKKITWGDSATTLRGKNGTRVSFVCPPHGTPSTVWGTTVYTDDSSICSAAVHAGHITRISGGRVTIEVRPGMQQYGGSAANGVTSQPYGQWAGSYVFP